MKRNLLDNLPFGMPQEIFTTLVRATGLRIEQIVSHGHASPADFWYDQSENEWIMLVKGAARLMFEDEIVELVPGDSLTIPAHRRHRVDWTTPDEPTVWLAVFY
ncbi:cupin domain-containing protein [Schlesneria sp. DSM 10557]|uniref:cupin domain-containing protein n=1 Tax=Schlesneria sp. DSM 10557 TaxID=3044399 RepID=UPI0035A0C431